MFHRKLAVIALLATLLLAACGGSEAVREDLRMSGAKSAIATMPLLSERIFRVSKPSAMLGTFSAMFASQGIFLPVKTALVGIEAQRKILEGQESPVSSETFALLIEVGGVLQVDIVDALNRSSDRSRFLDAYLQSLRNAGTLIERKVAELQELEGQLEDKRKAERKAVRDTESTLKKAMKEQNYTPAAELEEKLAEQSGTLAETESKLKRTKDISGRFEALGEIAAIKLQAIENNREILLAGLKVIDVPGIQDLRILEEGASWRRNAGGGIFAKPR